MKIEKNLKVTFSYTLWDINGNILEKTPENAPVTYLHGYRYIIPGLEEFMEGKEEGQIFRVEVPCEKAFGIYQHDKLIAVPREDLADLPDLKVGMEVEMVQDNLEAREKRDMFWTPQSVEDLLSDSSPEDEEENEEEDAEIYMVREIREDEVILDANPPLAGRDLIFEVEIVKVEVASFEEIEESYLNSEEDPGEEGLF